MSSQNAFAVMAIMGTEAASSLGRLRMAFVASYPSILGIWISMRMASKVPDGEEDKISSS